MADNKPWWFPVLTDDAWIKAVRKEYPDSTDPQTDEEVRETYAGGAKYETLWDNLGDAYEQFEKLADAYLALLTKTEAS